MTQKYYYDEIGFLRPVPIERDGLEALVAVDPTHPGWSKVVYMPCQRSMPDAGMITEMDISLAKMTDFTSV